MLEWPPEVYGWAEEGSPAAWTMFGLEEAEAEEEAADPAGLGMLNVWFAAAAAAAAAFALW